MRATKLVMSASSSMRPCSFRAMAALVPNAFHQALRIDASGAGRADYDRHDAKSTFGDPEREIRPSADSWSALMTADTSTPVSRPACLTTRPPMITVSTLLVSIIMMMTPVTWLSGAALIVMGVSTTMSASLPG
jgi:hypothetical protein